MRTRERGAAHINIFFFLVVLVLFLGAAGFAYVQTNDNAALRTQLASAEQDEAQAKLDVQIRDHYIEDIRKVIGEAGTYEGRTGFNYPDDTGAELRPLENVSTPANIKNTIAAFTRQVAIPESLSTPLGSLLAEAKKAVDTKDTEIANLKTQNTTLQGQVNTANSQVAEANQQKTTEVQKLNQDQSELRQYITSEYNKQKDLINNVRTELQTRREEMDTLKEQHAQQVLAVTKENNLLKARIDALRDKIELINPPQEPDGRVISASQAAGRAWVNLGRKDMLPLGTIFRISSPDKNAFKGYGRVTKVDYDRAELTIYDLVDRFDPIAKGDLIANDLYSANVRRNIFLMGRFSYPLNKPQVKMILEGLGNTVHDKIGPGVDLVLVGSDTLNEESDGFVPVTETQEYRDALFLGIEIATLNKVRQFLKLGDD